MAFVAGLDLGKVADFSALAVLEKRPAPVPTRRRRHLYAVRWLETWELGTPYSAIIAGVKARFDTPALRWSALAVDYTGVGTAVVEQIRGVRVPARLHPVLITAGHTVQAPDLQADPPRREWHVPKKELVSTLLVLLEAGLLKWDAKRLPNARRFEKELSDFRVSVTRSRNETFGADGSQHDDLVLAVALAAWLGEHTGGGDPRGIGTASAPPVASAAAAPPGVFAPAPRESAWRPS